MNKVVVSLRPEDALELEPLHIEDGDVLLAHSRVRLSVDGVENIRKVLRSTLDKRGLPNVLVLLTDTDADLTLLKDADMLRHGWVRVQKAEG
jgi:hypothetical protein